MFSGIVHALADTLTLEHHAGGATLKLRGRPLEGTRPGSSIAINGACLTVTDIGADFISFDLSGETLSRTNLGSLTAGDSVNLEPALRLGDPVDGHLVLGHVDGVGTLISQEPAGEGTTLTVSVPRELLRYIAVKGSLAVDGVALTVTRKEDDQVSFAIIPYTYTHTTFCRRPPGSSVNIEVDVLARYVESLTQSV